MEYELGLGSDRLPLLGDALHLALVSWHKCDFLLTWNCANIANANKVSHIKRARSTTYENHDHFNAGQCYF